MINFIYSMSDCIRFLILPHKKAILREPHYARDDMGNKLKEQCLRSLDYARDDNKYSSR